MAPLRNRQVLELGGLRLDQPLTNCGELSPGETRLVSEARFHSAQQTFQAALDRSVDLVVLHSEILSERSAGGRAPWFLNRWIEACAQRGVPVVWAEKQHNAWMQRFVPAQDNLIRVVPGEVHQIVTRAGTVLFLCGIPKSEGLPIRRDENHTIISLDFPTGARLDREASDLILQVRDHTSDRIQDFVTTAMDGDSQPLASLHSVRADRTNTCESLAVTPLGCTRVSCSLSANLLAGNLAEHLTEEVDAAAGRYFAERSHTQLLLVDLTVSGHGQVWGSLWDAAERQRLQTELSRLSRHPGCRVRSITPVADGIEATRACAFTPVVNAIWAETTERPTPAVRSLAELAPESVELGRWSQNEKIPVDHPLAAEVRHACLHRLRSAS